MLFPDANANIQKLISALFHPHIYRMNMLWFWEFKFSVEAYTKYNKIPYWINMLCMSEKRNNCIW